jgi:hypothetical protein
VGLQRQTTNQAQDNGYQLFHGRFFLFLANIQKYFETKKQARIAPVPEYTHSS